MSASDSEARARRLEGKVAVITGGTAGLGRATARRFAEEGAAVVVSSRHVEAAEALAAELNAAGGRALGVACDVRVAAQVEALARAAESTFGAIDVWVNNAGVSAPYGRTLDVSAEELERATLTNVLGALHGSRVALTAMLRRNAGVLINVVGRGERNPLPLQNAYGASKAWVRNFTRALAREYRDHPVGIYTFQPGLMLTDLTLHPTVARGFEDAVQPLSTVLQLWGIEPSVAAERLVTLASGTPARHRVAQRSHGAWWLLVGPLRRLVGRAPRPHVDPIAVQ